MAAAVLLSLVVLFVQQAPVVESKDCCVLVTGPDQPWTPARLLHWRSEAPSANQQLSDRPPGLGEAVLSVRSAAVSLRVRLFSGSLPGGYLIAFGPDGWNVYRTFVGAVRQIATGQERAEPAAVVDEWTSYLVSVSNAGQLRLLQLHDNGTSTEWLSTRDPEPLAVDRVSAGTLEPPAWFGGTSRPARQVPQDPWTFWKFSCIPSLYPREPLCHIWPSWDGVMPQQFKILTLSIQPVLNVQLHVLTSSVAEVLLMETPERYYLVSVSPTALALSRAELGASTPRELARTCLSPTPGPPRFRLVWVSLLSGFIQVGLDEPADAVRPCGQPEQASAAPERAHAVVEPAGNGTEPSPIEPAANSTELSPAEPAANSTEPATESPAAARTTESPDVRSALLSWQDGVPYYVLSYGFRTPGGQGLWTVDCRPGAGKATEDGMDGKSSDVSCQGGIVFDSLKQGVSPHADDAGLAGDADRDREEDDSACSSAPSQRYLLAIVVLSVVSAVLVLVSAVLAGLAVSRWRRRACRLPERRLSLPAVDQLRPDAFGHEYAELRLYDNLRPMDARPGESTFKPVRRQSTPMVPRSASPGQLPPPPDDI